MGSMFAQYAEIDTPNPCRKYHISSDNSSAELIAQTCLPILREHGLAHKVVETLDLLIKQSRSDQVGKFITIYAPLTKDKHHPVFTALSEALRPLKAQGLIMAAPKIPRHRPSHHVFYEAPIDDTLFIFGGFTCDPYA